MGYPTEALGRLTAELRERLRALLFRSRMERELDEELRFHIERQTEENLERGMEPGEARRQARLAFGGVERYKEQVRDARGTRLLEEVVKDVRYAVRTLRKRPGFTAVAVLTLALGIGANTAMFSIVETVLLEPLPYPEADELVTIHNRAASRDRSIHPWTPAAIFLDVQRSADSFERIAGYYPQTFAISGADRPFQLEGAQVTPDFFRLLQAGMALGRDFVAADARAGAPRTAILSHGVWQRRFGGSRDVIGRSIQAASTGRPLPGDGEAYEVIGVLERGFDLYAPRVENPGLWIPHEVDGYAITLARLREGVPLRQAQAELDVVTGRHEERYPDSLFNPGWTALKSEVVGADRTALLILQLAVGVVLLIACVNMANLLLARSGDRQTELAIRSALGASGGRLLRQALTESVMLCVLGGMAALLVMTLGLGLALPLAPGNVPRIEEVSIDGSVLLFTLGVSVAVGLLVGAVPAVAGSRHAPNDVLKEGGRTHARSRRQRRVSQVLVIAEVALVLVLLVGAALLGRSFVSLTGQETGFRAENVVAVSMDIPQNRYRSAPELSGFYGRVLERLRNVPGVESAAVAKNPPLERGNSSRDYRLAGEAETGTRGAQYDVVSPGYFRTLDIPLLRGRGFEETDRRDTQPVAIIDEAMWRDAWPGQDPIGKRFRFEDGEDRWRTVVGVVGDIRGSGLAHDPRPGFYVPYRQRPDDAISLTVAHRFTVFLVRSRAGMESLVEPLRQGIWDVDPLQPAPEIASLESIASESVSPERFRALLLGTFAAIALVLAIAGIYGVVERLVTQRRHEFGVRMAMGARRSDVLRMVVGQGTALAGLGVALGLPAALGATRLLSGMLYGVSPTDPLTLAAVAVLLAGAALLASYVPARRATKVDPMVTLNVE